MPLKNEPKNQLSSGTTEIAFTNIYKNTKDPGNQPSFVTPNPDSLEEDIFPEDFDPNKFSIGKGENYDDWVQEYLKKTNSSQKGTKPNPCDVRKFPWCDGHGL